MEITPRPDLQAAVARWQCKITAPKLEADYLAVMAAAAALNCWRWLLNLRRREKLASPALAA